MLIMWRPPPRKRHQGGARGQGRGNSTLAARPSQRLSRGERSCSTITVIVISLPMAPPGWLGSEPEAARPAREVKTTDRPTSQILRVARPSMSSPYGHWEEYIGVDITTRACVDGSQSPGSSTPFAVSHHLRCVSCAGHRGAVQGSNDGLHLYAMRGGQLQLW
jgi:hypothetical protein